MNNQCPMCEDFNAPTIKLLLGHIGRVHSHSPHFSFTCGLDGCLMTLKSYPSLKKHIQRKHKKVIADEDPLELSSGLSPSEDTSTPGPLSDSVISEDRMDCEQQQTDLLKINAARLGNNCK